MYNPTVYENRSQPYLGERVDKYFDKHDTSKYERFSMHAARSTGTGTLEFFSAPK